MDLLAPCRNCLQCLPFFHWSSPNHAITASTSPAAEEDTSPETVKAGEEKATSLQTPTADLPVSEAKTELCKAGEPQEAPIAPAAVITQKQGAKSPALEQVDAVVKETSTPSAISEIIIAPPVTSNEAAVLPQIPETSKTAVPSDLPLMVPFINDVTFSTGFLMPLPSPVTPAPMGSGYTDGPHQIEHKHVHPHHGHGHPHEHPVPSHVPTPHPPLESAHEHHKGPSHHHEHHPHHQHDHHGDGHAVPLGQVPVHEHHHEHSPHDACEHEQHHVSKHGRDNGDGYKEPSHHDSYHEPEHSHDDTTADEIEDALPAVETSQSAPVLSTKNEPCSEHESSDINGTGLLETYHSQPILQVGGEVDEANDHQHVVDDGEGHDTVQQQGRHSRRRDRLKDQCMGIHELVKHGGHHLKGEGSKHLQSIVNNINKHAQYIEESTSFLNVPRI